MSDRKWEEYKKKLWCAPRWCRKYLFITTIIIVMTIHMWIYWTLIKILFLFYRQKKKDFSQSKKWWRNLSKNATRKLLLSAHKKIDRNILKNIMMTDEGSTTRKNAFIPHGILDFSEEWTETHEERADSFQHIFEHDHKLSKAILRTAKNLIGFCWLKQAAVRQTSRDGNNKIFAKDTKER